MFIKLIVTILTALDGITSKNEKYRQEQINVDHFHTRETVISNSLKPLLNSQNIKVRFKAKLHAGILERPSKVRAFLTLLLSVMIKNSYTRKEPCRPNQQPP